MVISIYDVLDDIVAAAGDGMQGVEFTLEDAEWVLSLVDVGWDYDSAIEYVIEYVLDEIWDSLYPEAF